MQLLGLTPASPDHIQSGSFCEVTRCTDDDGLTLAVKIITNFKKPELLRLDEGEVHSLKLHHPNIVKTHYLILYRKKDSSYVAIKDIDEIPKRERRDYQIHAIINELIVGADLHTILNSEDPEFSHLKEAFPTGPDTAIKIGLQAAMALAYCHKSGIVYRDIKTENLMIDSNSHQLKMVDFGLNP